jgi:hypothetical protein
LIGMYCAIFRFARDVFAIFRFTRDVLCHIPFCSGYIVPYSVYLSATKIWTWGFRRNETEVPCVDVRSCKDF